VRGQKYWSDNAVFYSKVICHLTMMNFHIFYIIFSNTHCWLLWIYFSIMETSIFYCSLCIHSYFNSRVHKTVVFLLHALCDKFYASARRKVTSIAVTTIEADEAVASSDFLGKEAGRERGEGGKKKN